MSISFSNDDIEKLKRLIQEGTQVMGEVSKL